MFRKNKKEIKGNPREVKNRKIIKEKEKNLEKNKERKQNNKRTRKRGKEGKENEI